MTEHYVDRAERVIREMIEVDKRRDFTTTKIRNILSIVSDLYNDVLRYRSETISEELYNRLQYLKMRMAYEAGRERIVETFLKQSQLLREIEKVGRSKKALLEFCHYMEALVAYHKFYYKEKN